MNQIGNLFVLLTMGLIGGLIGQRFKLPGGPLVGAMLMVIFFKIVTRADWSVPSQYGFVVQVLVGVLVGVGYSREIAGEIHHLAIPVAVSTLVLVSSGLLVSILFTRIGIFNISTGYIATSPGAMAALIPMAADSGAVTTVVAAFHFFRLVFIMLTAPFLLRWLQAWFGLS